MTEPLLTFEGVTVDFDGFKALDDVDFALESGELRFLIGPNGAGKTTLIDAVTGLNQPSAGSILFADRDITRTPDHRRVRLGVGRSFQAPTIFDGLTVADNLDLAATYRLGFHRRLRRRPGLTAEMAEVLERVGLLDRADEPGAELGHGGRRWLEIAMLLIQQPSLLLFDEPAAGMSPEERSKLGELLQELAAERTVMVVEHDMVFMRRFARRVTVLHQGRILTEGTVDEVQNDPMVREVYLGRTREERTGAKPVSGGAEATAEPTAETVEEETCLS